MMNIKVLEKQKGITIIALVITIVVLIILAGITISMTIGSNGIITRAREAKETTRIAQIKEDIALEILNEQIEKGSESISDEKLEEIISKYGKLEDDKDTITTNEGYKISLKEIYSGTTSENIGNNTDLVNSLKNRILSLEKEIIDGKKEIAEAITNKGVETSKDETFSVMAKNISLITGKDAEKKKYKIMYNANSGTGLMENEEKIEGTSVTILENGFIAPSGKKFKEWNTSQDGTGVTYKAGQNYETDEDLTLYAIWRDSRVYLYNNGVINTDLVGNFIAEDRYLWGASKARKVPTLNLNSNSMYIAQRSTNTNEYSSGNVISTKAIDLSDFNTFTINFTNVSNSSALTNIQNGSSGQIIFCFSNQQITEFYGDGIELVRGLTMNQNYNRTINISGISNSCYLVFRAVGTYFTSDIVATNVLNMYLE